MTRRTPQWMPAVTLVCAAAAWVGAIVTVRAGTAAPRTIPAVTAEKSAPAPANPPAKPQATKATPASKLPGSYVDEDKCLTCHAAQAEGYAKTPHHRVNDSRT